MSPFTVVSESAVERAPSAMRPFTVLAEVTAALASISIPPLTVSAAPAVVPAGTCTEPLTRLDALLDSSQPQRVIAAIKSISATGLEPTFPCKNLSPEYGDAFMVGKSDV